MRILSLVPILCAAAAAYATSACTPVDPTRSVQKEGELGNGGFLFLCDDSVQCEKTANDVSRFPSAVAQGATFNVRYVLKQDPATLQIRLNEYAKDRGITVQTVGSAAGSSAPAKYTYLSSGPSGFVGVTKGFATLVARDAAGSVVDYLTVSVQPPDAIAVYDFADVRALPAKLANDTISRGASKTYRAVAQKANADLGGALSVQWSTTDPTIASVDAVSGVKVTVTAKKAGKTRLTALGGSFERAVEIEVTP